MKVRGERECKRCGTRWSYYETGRIECPDCGSLKSVGVGERREHTAGPAELDLTGVAADVDDVPIRDLAGRAAEVCGEFVRSYGFVHAGELRPLTGEFAAAMELRYVGRALSRRMRVDDDEELYFVRLLRGAREGDRPDPTEVPDSLVGPRGLAIAAALEAYHRDVSRVESDHEPPVSELLGRIRDRRKRIEALDGEVPPREAERCLAAMQDVGAYLVRGDEAGIARAEERLDAVK